MRSSGRPFSDATERGSTVLEVLVAILVISILSVGMYAAVSAAFRSSTRSNRSIAASDSLLRLDDRLRDLAARILTPFWMPSHVLDEEDGAFSVAYLDGDPEKRLTLRFAEGAVAVSEGETVYRYRGFKDAAFSAAADEAGSAYGISVELVMDGGQATRIVARFGGTPFQNPYSEVMP